LAYASVHRHALIDRELYLPRSWADDQDRRRAAGIPEDVKFTTKPRQAQAMISRAIAAGVPFARVTKDETYRQARYLQARRLPADLGYLSNGITRQSRSSPSQQDRHQGRRTVVAPVRLTQNPAGLSRQWMHSWRVCGSQGGTTVMRSLSRGACGRAPTRGSEVTTVRAGAGRVEYAGERDGSGRGIAAAAGMAA
jgi:DDE superfamily endonuclease